MTNPIPEFRALLQRAQQEIRYNREELQILRAQMHVVNIFGAIVMGKPTSGGMSPDIVWEIENLLKKTEPKPPTTPTE